MNKPKLKLLLPCSALAVAVVLAAALYWAFGPRKIPAPPEGSIETNLTITQIWLVEEGFPPRLTCRRGEGSVDLWLSKDTRYYRENGREISYDDLHVGQEIKLVSGTLAIYEPRTTYVQCYQIIVQ